MRHCPEAGTVVTIKTPSIVRQQHVLVCHHNSISLLLSIYIGRQCSQTVKLSTIIVPSIE